MPMTPEAAKLYKPRRPNVTIEDVVTPEERERRQRDMQAMKDEANREKIKSMGYANGGMTASARADGCAQRGKTRGKVI